MPVFVRAYPVCMHLTDLVCVGLFCCCSNPATFTDLYIVFECMDLDLNKLGRDTKQSIGVDHVRWFMYQVRVCRILL
jgi:hypothetical protein